MDDRSPAALRAAMARALEPRWLEPTPWTHGDADFTRDLGDYHRIWRDKPGGHKKYAYFELYETLFGAMRGRPVRMLEIGVFQGASLATWKDYLGPQAQIVGIDIDPECARFEDCARNVFVRVGDQSDRAFLDAVGREFGPFDAVLDDGSHMTAHQIASFNALFIEHLAPGGLYVIEDTNTSLWRRYRNGPADMLDLVAALAAATHAFYAEHDYRDYAREAHPHTFMPPRATTLVAELRVFDAAIAVRKATETHYPPLVDRRP